MWGWSLVLGVGVIFGARCQVICCYQWLYIITLSQVICCYQWLYIITLSQVICCYQWLYIITSSQVIYCYQWLYVPYFLYSSWMNLQKYSWVYQIKTGELNLTWKLKYILIIILVDSINVCITIFLDRTRFKPTLSLETIYHLEI